MNTPMVDNAKVMAKGQVTIPIDIRKKLNISEGDRLTFICDNDKVIMMNSALYAMKVLQGEMKGEAEKVGLYSDDDVVNMIMKMRAGDEDFLMAGIENPKIMTASEFVNCSETS